MDRKKFDKLKKDDKLKKEIEAADELRKLCKALDEIYYTQSERYTRALTRFRAERMEK